MNKTNFKRRLILGSANFTQKYGADPVKINISEIKKILNLANNNKVNKIDTAENYLHDSIFFKYLRKRFKLITKIRPDHNWASLSFCEEELKKQLKNFKKNKIKILLFHDVEVLFDKLGPKIFNNLEKLKDKGYFKKIGISIYDTNCLKYLISKYNIDVVQCPYNILDKRIIYSGWLNKLKNKGIEVHVRSVFLQGLLVNKMIYKKNYFKKWRSKILKWFNHLQKNGISPINYCLNDLLKYDFDQIIIGVNNSDNLREILNFKLLSDKKKLINFTSKDLKLIDPRCWK
jgi:aryl-alcohol dehydrogenase-like predicted oxidoreductase